MAISSYPGRSTTSSGVVRILKDLSASPEGRDVLVIEDIVDSGRTLDYINRNLSTRQPSSLKVCSLHTHGTESTALVYWPANEVFQKHTHFGGEEIVVLKGCFIDEHGEYPQGSWIRSPHMSVHFPYVEEETLILVKVGHLAV